MLNSRDVNSGPNAMDKIGNFFTTPQGWGNLLLPGYSLVDQMFDINGSQAATTAYQRQIQLDNMQREYNSGEAEKQRNWEEMMSSTAIQRQVSDAKAAGINPVALFGSGASGAGADTPSGSSAQSSAGNATIANNKITAAAGVVALFLRMILTKGK